MKAKKQALSQHERRAWADMGHLFFLDALMSVSGLACRQIAFQGGTSLHLSWGSPRFSEDIDFLLDGEAVATERMHKAMRAVEDRVKRLFHAQDPGFEIEVKDISTNPARMMVYCLDVAHVAKLGKAKVKAEFWRVPSEYLERYQVEMRTPMPKDGELMARIQSGVPVPSATISSILADKIVAMAYRERIKWRDIFDVWWLGEQFERRFPEKTIGEMAEHARFHATAYQGPGLEVGLRSFLDRRDALLKGEGCDLDRWLPESLSRLLIPDVVPEMGATALNLVKDVLDCLEGQPKAEAKRVSRATRFGP